MSFSVAAQAIHSWVRGLDETRLSKFFPDLDARIQGLERLQGHHYANRRLAAVALVHRSALVYWPHDKSHIFSNERLEFLGDAFLNFYVAGRAMSEFTQMSEGELSKLRAALVGTENLAEKARRLKLQDLLMFGRGEIAKGGFRDDKRQNILADAFEAVTAALVLDAGQEHAWSWLESLFTADLLTAQQTLTDFDVKTRFQQWTQGICGKPPTYKLIKTISTPQETQFVVAGFLGKTEIARASATNKREASKAVAARMQKLVDMGQLTAEQVKKFVAQGEHTED
ncbi:MAG: ribonuclease [Pseudomonadota bacterium]